LSSYFSAFSSVGLTKPDAPFVDAIYDPLHGPSLGIGGGDLTVNAEADLDILEKCHTDPYYVSFTDHPALRTMVRALTDWKEELLLRRTMLRHHVPNAPATGVHYDKLFLRGGDAFFLTAWVPIGDIAVNGGGLIYLEDSIELGKAIEDDFSHRNANLEDRISAFNANMTKFGVLCDSPKQFEGDHNPDRQTLNSSSALKAAEKKSYKWLVANYEAGDVVFHHPNAIHASGRNADKDGKIRLSTDLRFYDREELDRGGVDKRWLKFWTLGDNL
jgi:phytanoyl-CoA hydroxylase